MFPALRAHAGPATASCCYSNSRTEQNGKETDNSFLQLTIYTSVISRIESRRPLEWAIRQIRNMRIKSYDADEGAAGGSRAGARRARDETRGKRGRAISNCALRSIAHARLVWDAHCSAHAN